MAHKEQRNFLKRVKKKIPKAFKDCKVLDIGSFDVNGTEEPFFDNCDFIGLDIGPGQGVHVVCPAQDYNAHDETFGTIISCECWEHNPFYKESIQNAIRMLKPGGYFIFTCATTGRPVHGVASMEKECKEKYENWKTMPNVSRENWDNEYYKNLTESDIRACIDIDKIFNEYEFEVEPNHCDLYFWGIKKKNKILKSTNNSN
ncbi:MAG: methyltransferase domain-containing protein [Candidatus Thorarchaeota archaeon]